MQCLVIDSRTPCAAVEKCSDPLTLLLLRFRPLSSHSRDTKSQDLFYARSCLLSCPAVDLLSSHYSLLWSGPCPPFQVELGVLPDLLSHYPHPFAGSGGRAIQLRLLPVCRVAATL